MIYSAIYIYVIQGPLTFEAAYAWFGRKDLTDWSVYARTDFISFKNAWLVMRGMLYGWCVQYFPLVLCFMIPLGYCLYKRELRKIFSGNAFAVICVFWILMRIALYTWFNPNEPFLWSVETMTPAIIIGAVILQWAIQHQDKVIRRIFRGFTAFILAVMVYFNALALLPLKGDTIYQYTKELPDKVGQKDLIITDNWSVKLAMDYHTQLQSMFLYDILMFRQFDMFYSNTFQELKKSGGQVYIAFYKDLPEQIKIINDIALREGLARPQLLAVKAKGLDHLTRLYKSSIGPPLEVPVEP